MASLKAEKPACTAQVPVGQPNKELPKATEVKPKAVSTRPAPKVEQKPRAPTKVQAKVGKPAGKT
ncbi:hypothetical protein IEQ34_022658 [Dendrobium chrysotoxum]|uniref:Uncharacterized protein n=1 Tax=Dendrobium chrysotoxum TaxID=161865 RepID=A0AAV7FZH5_DENCH|nr:hypothetical protein IEQ34_022658 [Dendrobium chrysotoxum]